MSSKANEKRPNWADRMNSSSSDSETSTRAQPKQEPEPDPAIYLTRFERLAQSRETSAAEQVHVSRSDCEPEGNESNENDASLSSYTADEIVKMINNLTSSIFSDWLQLKEVAENYHDRLRKRWESKTKGDKADVLLEAWPDMPFAHRSDFHAYSNGNFGRNVQEMSQFRDAYMWPQINLEDLTYGRALVLYVDSRGRNPPQDFVHMDWMSCFLGRRTNSITPRPLLKYYTMFLDGRTALRYGRIASWEKDLNAQEQLRTGSGCLTVKGLLVLELQQRILSFLVKCCHLLLGDLTTLFLAPGSARSFGLLDKSKLNVVAAEAPYRMFPKYDFNLAKKIIQARFNLAKDHMYALKTQPGYFGDALMQMKEHRYELMLDESGAKHPGIGSLGFWNGVVAQLLLHAYGDVWSWDFIRERMNDIVNLHEKYSGDLSPKRRLPKEYTRAIMLFKHTLIMISSHTSQELRKLLPRSPPYRHMFSRLSLNPVDGQFFAHEETKSDVIMGFFEIITDFSKLRLFDALDLTDELERAIEMDKKNKTKLSSLVARYVADLGTIGRIQRQFDFFQPWSSGFEFFPRKESEEAQGLISEYIRSKSEIYGMLFMETIPLADVGRASEGQFDYPSDRPHTDVTVKKMLESKRKLGVFWATFRQRCIENSSTAVYDHLEEISLTITNEAYEKEMVQSKVKLTSRALKVFKKLFYNGSQNDPSANTPWKDLVYAMSAMGFEVEKLHG